MMYKAVVVKGVIYEDLSVKDKQDIYFKSLEEIKETIKHHAVDPAEITHTEITFGNFPDPFNEAKVVGGCMWKVEANPQ